MGEEPNRLRKYFCNFSCQNSIHIMYLSQVSLNKKIQRATIHEIHPHICSVFMQAHTALQLLWTWLFLYYLDLHGRCWFSQCLFFWKGSGIQPSQARVLHIICYASWWRQQRKKIKFYLRAVKFCPGTVKLKFWSVSFVGKRKIKLIPCKWNKDDFHWSLKDQKEEKLTGLTVCHTRFTETAGRCFSSYLHIKTSSQVFQIIQQIDTAPFNWSLIISAAGAH